LSRADPSKVIDALVAQSYENGWDPEKDLPWDAAIDPDRFEVPDTAALSASLPAYRRLGKAQKSWLKRRELASHLSCLAYGEQRAAVLAAETALIEPNQDPTAMWFLATLMADESKHFATLDRYLSKKAEASYAPTPSLEKVFAALTRARDYELNLFVGQVVLEGTAASLLSSLLIGVKEPLLRELLRRILRDEARHMKFAHLFAGSTMHAKMDPRRRRAMEEILFEAAVAGASCLLPLPVWDELDLDRKKCIPAAVNELKRRGVIRFYTHVIGRRLARRGFPADKLEQMLERMLEGRLRAAG
jgi:hypothetical protein